MHPTISSDIALTSKAKCTIARLYLRFSLSYQIITSRSRVGQNRGLANSTANYRRIGLSFSTTTFGELFIEASSLFNPGEMVDQAMAEAGRRDADRFWLCLSGRIYRYTISPQHRNVRRRCKPSCTSFDKRFRHPAEASTPGISPRLSEQRRGTTFDSVQIGWAEKLDQSCARNGIDLANLELRLRAAAGLDLHNGSSGFTCLGAPLRPAATTIRL